MTKYLLADRERNYSDDSDFYAVFWDTETGTLRSEEYGTTRFPSSHVAPAEYLRDIPANIRQQAREFYAARLFELLRDADHKAVDEPTTARVGDTLRVIKDGTFKDKRSGQIVKFDSGEIASLIWIGSFRTFYRNGYQHPDRYNQRVGLKFEDGRVAFMRLENCKMARAYKTDEELTIEADQYAAQERYESLFSGGLYQL